MTDDQMYAPPPSDAPAGFGAKITRWILLGLGGVLLIPLFPFYVRIVKEYERGVIFRLGRLIGAKGPGLFLLIPIVDKMVVVDLRTIVHDVPSQEAITHDNVTVKVNAVIYYRVLDPATGRYPRHRVRARDVTGRPDHAPLGPGTVGSGRTARRTGGDQPQAPADHR